jgi:hypothetical protein
MFDTCTDEGKSDRPKTTGMLGASRRLSIAGPMRVNVPRPVVPQEPIIFNSSIAETPHIVETNTTNG